MFNNNYTWKTIRGLVASYPLDWNATWANNVTWVKTDKGYQNQAGSFNGSSSYINNWSNIGITWNNSFTISAWIKTTATWNHTILNYWTASLNQDINFRTSWWLLNANFFWWWWDVSSTTSVNDWNAHLLVITYNWSNIKVYVDWKYENTGWAVTANIAYWYSYIWKFSYNVDYFNWLIQNVDIYNVVLTEDEIRNLYLEWQRQLGAYSSPSYPSLLSWLVWYWDFRWDATNLVDWVKWTVNWATLTTDRFGNSNSAYSFDWNNRYIATSNLSWSIWDADFSTSWYINYSTFSSTDRVYMSWTRDFSIQTFSDWRIWIDLYNWVSYQAKSNILTTNTYYHFVWVRSKTGGLFMYINWNLVWTNTFTWNAWTISWTDSFWKDSRNTTSTPRFILDEFTIFNRALSSNEVKALYELTSKEYIYPSKVYDLPNLREWLILEYNWSNNWTTTLYDISWNGKNWTVSSTPTYKRQGRVKTISLTSQSISWASTSFSTAVCFEKISWKWGQVVNPAYITTTWITSWTREITSIKLYNRVLSTWELLQLYYKDKSNFIY